MSTVSDRPHTSETSESIPELLKELRDEATLLVRQEVALARQEMSEKAAKVVRNAGYLVAGGVVAFAGGALLLAALAVVLYGVLVANDVSHMTAGWLAPLITGGIVTAIGAMLVGKATASFSNMSVVPERTVDSLQQDKQLIKEKVTS